MAGNPDRTRDNTAPSNPRTSRNTGTRSNHRVLTHFHVVGNLNQIIDLAALTDSRVSLGAAINRGIGANADVIFYLYGTQLWHGLPALTILREAKAISPNHRACTDLHPVT
jgi:hypothetical protein